MTKKKLYTPPQSRAEQIDEQALEFHLCYPQVWNLFCLYTHDRISKGFANYSADAIMHRVRWDIHVPWTREEKDTFKINNNYVTWYARKFMREHPDYDGFFRLRARPSEERDPSRFGELQPADYPTINE